MASSISLSRGQMTFVCAQFMPVSLLYDTRVATPAQQATPDHRDGKTAAMAVAETRASASLQEQLANQSTAI
jgi:hypothetical protein